jgi:large subunit ribosomal protein MRP49
MHLTYAKKIYHGHQGSRHFWRHCLPRLKYHNPGIQMSVKQTDEQEGPAALTIFFSGPPRNAATAQNASNIQDKYAPAPTATENTVVLNTKHLPYAKIWELVKGITGAEEVSATSEESAQIEKYEQMTAKAAVDRARVSGIRQAKKDQERMLREARGEVEKLKQL